MSTLITVRHMQEAVWARNQNYMAIVKGLCFSKVPWYDLHVYRDEENQLHRAAHMIVDYVSDSASETEVAVHDVMGEPELIQVGWKMDRCLIVKHISVIPNQKFMSIIVSILFARVPLDGV